MPEPRADMLPDESKTISDVKEDVKTKEPLVEQPQEEVIQEEALPTPKEEDKPPKGFVPYQALDEERRKRKDLEVRVKDLEQQTSVASELQDDMLSDEGKALKQELLSVKNELSRMKITQEETLVFRQYPQLHDKLAEFDEYRSEYPGVALDKLARLFINEHGMQEQPKPRKGLEKPTAGPKTIQEPGTYSSDDIDRLMKTEPRRFAKLLQEGKINPDKIVYKAD